MMSTADVLVIEIVVKMFDAAIMFLNSDSQLVPDILTAALFFGLHGCWGVGP